MKPTTGRIVQYVISLADIEAIEAQRARMAELLLISPGQIGNTYVPGETVPMIIARIWSDICVNGQLILDGEDTLWVTSRNYDEHKTRQNQSWHWPEIEGVCELRVESTSEQPLTNGSGILPDMASPDVRASLTNASDPFVLSARIEQLKDELARKRQAENDLIRDRDRLIHGDLARLNTQLAEMTSQRDQLLRQLNAAQNIINAGREALGSVGL